MSDKEAIPEIQMTEKVSSNEGVTLEWDESDEKRIRNRMDVRIVPTVFALYLMCFIDRANIG